MINGQLYRQGNLVAEGRERIDGQETDHFAVRFGSVLLVGKETIAFESSPDL